MLIYFLICIKMIKNSGGETLMKKNSIILFIILLILVGCQKDEANDEHLLFPSDLLAVEKDDQWGYMNQEAEVVIDFQYDRASAFFYDTAIVKLGDQYQLIDSKGNELLDEAQTWLYKDPYSGMIFYKKEHKLGLYDLDGKKLTESIYDSIRFFSEGLSWYEINDLFGLIDDQGQIIIEATYEDAKDFKNGYAPVKKDGYWGAVDTKGNVVLDFKYENLHNINEKGQMIATKTIENSSYVYDLIDIKNQEVLIDDAHTLYAVSQQYIVKDEIDTDYYYYNPKNKETKTISYDIVDILSSYALIINIDDVAYHVLLDENFEIVHQVKSQYARFILYGDDYDFAIQDRRDNTINIYTLDQTESISIEASVVVDFVDHVIIAIKDGTYGVYDDQGELKINFDYMFIDYFDDGYFACYQLGSTTIYTSDYQILKLDGVEDINTWVNITSWK